MVKEYNPSVIFVNKMTAPPSFASAILDCTRESEYSHPRKLKYSLRENLASLTASNLAAKDYNPSVFTKKSDLSKIGFLVNIFYFCP